MSNINNSNIENLIGTREKEVSFEEFTKFMDGVEGEFVQVDINNVISTTIYLNMFTWDILKRPKSTKEILSLDDISEQGGFLSINMEDIKTITCIKMLLNDKYIMQLKNGIELIFTTEME